MNSPLSLPQRLRSPAFEARRKGLPTMYELPSEDPQEPGLPDEFHLHQPQLLSETFGPPGLDTLAPSNAALVALAVEGLAAAGARPATPDEARAMLRLGSR